MVGNFQQKELDMKTEVEERNSDTDNEWKMAGLDYMWQLTYNNDEEDMREKRQKYLDLGKYVEKETSECCAGWEGPQCMTPICRNPCNHGTCTDTNKCTCEEGWGGDVCDEQSGETYCYSSFDCDGQKTEPLATDKASCCLVNGMSWGNQMDQSCSTCDEGNFTIVDTSEVNILTCTHSGETNYRTFDGVRYIYKTTCKVTLMKTDRMQITSKTDCDPLDTCKCTQEIVVQISDGQTFRDYTYVDGIVNNIMPTSTVVNRDDISFYRMSESVYISTSVGFKIRVDSDGFVAISVEKEVLNGLIITGMCGNANLDIQGKSSVEKKVLNGLIITGMCGSANLDIHDEKKLATNQYEANKYGQIYTDSTSCGASLPECEPAQAGDAANACSLIRSRIFESCHEAVPYQTFEETCQKAYCTATLAKKDAARCDAIQNYATECSLQYVVITWRSSTMCPKECPRKNQYYTQCMTVCERKCGLSLNVVLQKEECLMCHPGCTCDIGFFEDHFGNCIDSTNCTCKDRNQKIIPPGASITLEKPCPQSW
ncbi:von Willebrand factor-like [Gigantopelta aegis]|uniref:von Willebrand factor-like n=1 Tax=Gigantopelta aegis TaxID=1735272 RepID=UPI001B88B506|nr:von Willebrand factor-like [Gigantopelta aegis]